MSFQTRSFTHSFEPLESHPRAAPLRRPEEDVEPPVVDRLILEGREKKSEMVVLEDEGVLDAGALGRLREVVARPVHLEGHGRVHPTQRADEIRAWAALRRASRLSHFNSITAFFK